MILSLRTSRQRTLTTTELHRIDAMMSALRGCAGAAAHATAPTLQRHDPLTLVVRRVLWSRAAAKDLSKLLDEREFLMAEMDMTFAL